MAQGRGGRLGGDEVDFAVGRGGCPVGLLPGHGDALLDREGGVGVDDAEEFPSLLPVVPGPVGVLPEVAEAAVPTVEVALDETESGDRALGAGVCSDEVVEVGCDAEAFVVSEVIEVASVPG